MGAATQRAVKEAPDSTHWFFRLIEQASCMCSVFTPGRHTLKGIGITKQSLWYTSWSFVATLQLGWKEAHRRDHIIGRDDLAGETRLPCIERVPAKQYRVQDDATRPDVGPLAIIMVVRQDDLGCLCTGFYSQSY